MYGVTTHLDVGYYSETLLNYIQYSLTSHLLTFTRIKVRIDHRIKVRVHISIECRYAVAH